VTNFLYHHTCKKSSPKHYHSKSSNM
jgi:hypothetical protein